jgi:hypothetical protein
MVRLPTVPGALLQLNRRDKRPNQLDDGSARCLRCNNNTSCTISRLFRHQQYIMINNIGHHHRWADRCNTYRMHAPTEMEMA